MKVLIAYPPLKGKGSPMLTQNRQFQWFHNPSYIYPLVPSYAATMLKLNGYDVLWKDCIAERANEEEFFAFVEKEHPTLIAFESKTPVIKQHWQMIDRLKAIYPDILFVLMGDHVSALPYESLKNSQADFVITGGDYDFSLLSIVEKLVKKGSLLKGIWYREKREILSTGDFELSADLNTLPFIDRELTKACLYGEKWKKRTPFFYTMAGRDCPWAGCSFCSWTTLYPNFRVRRPENLLDEIGYLIERYETKEVFDDTGTFPGGKWLNSFCKGMIERGYNNEILFSCNMRADYLKPAITSKLKEAGFRKVKIGLESGCQQTLDKINKGISLDDIIEGCKTASRDGIDIHLTVMVGYPWETKDDIKKTIDTAASLMVKGYVEMLQATVVIPYPGTPLYKKALQEDLFRIDPYDYERYDMTEPVFKTPDIPPEDIMRFCSDIYKLYTHPRFILRNILKIRSRDDIDYMIRGSKAITGHIKDFLRG